MIFKRKLNISIISKLKETLDNIEFPNILKLKECFCFKYSTNFQTKFSVTVIR